MAAEEEDLREQICNFCHSKENDELVYGAKKRLGKIITHYHCLLLSSSMEQKGADSDGILGFLLPDIMKELSRGKRLACVYCKRTGATIGCVNTKCRKVFHLPCGIKKGSLHQFFGQFKSFCHNHRVSQKIPMKTLTELASGPGHCAICYDNVSSTPGTNTIWAPCCKKDALFHRECVQQLASSAGYFFKCPLCNNKEDFNEAMLQCGIFIPEQDASWETVPNAFEELLHRHNRCDFEPCRNPRGRFEDEKGTRWELILCDSCGSQGVHMSCGGLKWSNPTWECNDCSSMAGEAAEPNEPDNEPEENSATDDDSTSNSLPPSPTGRSPPPPTLLPEVPGKPVDTTPNTSLQPPTLTPPRLAVPIPHAQPIPAAASSCDIITVISDDSEDDIEIIDLPPNDCKELITKDGSKIKVVQVSESQMSTVIEGDVKVKDNRYIGTTEGGAHFERISKGLALRSVTLKLKSPSPPDSPDIVIIDDDVPVTPSQPMVPRRRMVSLPRSSPSVARRPLFNPTQQPQFGRNPQMSPYSNVGPQSQGRQQTNTGGILAQGSQQQFSALQNRTRSMEGIIQQPNSGGKSSQGSQQFPALQNRTRSTEGILGRFPPTVSPKQAQPGSSPGSVIRSPRSSLAQPSSSTNVSPTSNSRLRPNRSTPNQSLQRMQQHATTANEINSSTPSSASRFQPMRLQQPSSTVVRQSPQQQQQQTPNQSYHQMSLKQMLARPLSNDQGQGLPPKITHRLVQQDYNHQPTANNNTPQPDYNQQSKTYPSYPPPIPQAALNNLSPPLAQQLKRQRPTEVGNDYFQQNHPPSYEETMGASAWRSNGGIQQSRAPAGYQLQDNYTQQTSQWQTSSFSGESQQQQQRMQQQGNVILQAGATYLSVLSNAQPQGFIVAQPHLIQGAYIPSGNAPPTQPNPMGDTRSVASRHGGVQRPGDDGTGATADDAEETANAPADHATPRHSAQSTFATKSFVKSRGFHNRLAHPKDIGFKLLEPNKLKLTFNLSVRHCVLTAPRKHLVIPMLPWVPEPPIVETQSRRRGRPPKDPNKKRPENKSPSRKRRRYLANQWSKGVIKKHKNRDRRKINGNSDQQIAANCSQKSSSPNSEAGPSISKTTGVPSDAEVDSESSSAPLLSQSASLEKKPWKRSLFKDSVFTKPSMMVKSKKRSRCTSETNTESRASLRSKLSMKEFSFVQGSKNELQGVNGPLDKVRKRSKSCSNSNRNLSQDALKELDFVTSSTNRVQKNGVLSSRSSSIDSNSENLKNPLSKKCFDQNSRTSRSQVSLKNLSFVQGAMNELQGIPLRRDASKTPLSRGSSFDSNSGDFNQHLKINISNKSNSFTPPRFDRSRSQVSMKKLNFVQGSENEVQCIPDKSSSKNRKINCSRSPSVSSASKRRNETSSDSVSSELKKFKKNTNNEQQANISQQESDGNSDFDTKIRKSTPQKFKSVSNTRVSRKDQFLNWQQDKSSNSVNNEMKKYKKNTSIEQANSSQHKSDGNCDFDTKVRKSTPQKLNSISNTHVSLKDQFLNWQQDKSSNSTNLQNKSTDKHRRRHSCDPVTIRSRPSKLSLLATPMKQPVRKEVSLDWQSYDWLNYDQQEDVDEEDDAEYIERTIKKNQFIEAISSVKAQALTARKFRPSSAVEQQQREMMKKLQELPAIG